MKRYQDTGGAFREAYNQTVRVSSVPVVVWQSSKLDYIPEEECISFDLEWKASYGLYPDQIVQPASYELNQYNLNEGTFVPVTTVGSPAEPSFNGRLSGDLVGQWRARIVNDCGIPGPWSYSEIDRGTVAGELQKCVGINEVKADWNSNGQNEILIQWKVANAVSGVRYEVERRGGGSPRLVANVEGNTEWCDTDFTAKANTKTTYYYRVWAILGDIQCDWQPSRVQLCQVVIDRTILRVGERVRVEGFGEGIMEEITGRRAYVQLDSGPRWLRPLSELKMV